MTERQSCSGVIMPCADGCVKAGYAFVATQDVARFYDYESAFVSGTVFPDLSIPKGKYGPMENFSEK